MIHVVLVALGATAGSAMFFAAMRRQWDTRTILLANTAICAVAGLVAGMLVFVAQQNVVSSFLGYGVLGTAAPYVSVLLGLSAPRDTSQAWQLIRRTAAVLAVNALFCATAASVTYMLIVGGLVYTRGTP